ncbi:MAG: diguanylate cyclase [Gammaproteobacteria bacterium]|nr:diguanylate cyclase [Gammaproteobacteria bacterium]
MITEYQHFNFFGWDREKINARLRLCEIGEEDKAIARKLQDLVIQPNSKRIINDFYDYLFSFKEYRQLVGDTNTVNKLKKTQEEYLHTLGLDFDQVSYFDVRLRVGVAHHRIEMPLSLYECAYTKLRSIICAHIPTELEDDLQKELSNFLEKITSLDMSIAIDSYHDMSIRGFQRSIDKLEKRKEKLKEISHMDPLTGIANRNFLLHTLEHDIAAGKHKLWLIMIDIDNLGSFNDSLGHLVGDYILKETIKRLSLQKHKHLLGRYGGDEFLMIVYDADKNNISNIKQSNQHLIEAQSISIGKKEFHISISQGAMPVTNDEPVSSLIQKVGKDLTADKNKKITAQKEMKSKEEKGNNGASEQA